MEFQSRLAQIVEFMEAVHRIRADQCLGQHGPELPPTCPRCDDTGYYTPYAGGETTSYCCDCAVGDRQFEVEADCWRELELGYDGMVSEYQAAYLQ